MLRCRKQHRPAALISVERRRRAQDEGSKLLLALAGEHRRPEACFEMFRVASAIWPEDGEQTSAWKSARSQQWGHPCDRAHGRQVYKSEGGDDPRSSASVRAKERTKRRPGGLVTDATVVVEVG